MIKDAVEDYRRGKHDALENNAITHVVTGANEQLKPTRWADVKVGQVLKICNGEAVPADIILIKSSEPKGRSYVETKGLDGETRLRKKTP